MSVAGREAVRGDSRGFRGICSRRRRWSTPAAACGGRPKGSLDSSLLDGKEDEIRSFLELGVSKTAIAKITGVSRTTLYSFVSPRNCCRCRASRAQSTSTRASSCVWTTDLRSRSHLLRKPNESRFSQGIDDLTRSQPSTSANALAPKSCRSMARRRTSMLG